MAARFESIEHPGDLPWVAVYARALIVPSAACLLPVMILTLARVLEGSSVLPHAFWGAAAAVFVANLWTSFTLRRRVAEIRINGPWVTVFTVWELMRGRAERPQRVFDVRDYGSWTHAAVGLTSYELRRADWPHYALLVAGLDEARLTGLE